jgi:quinol monooxygenase YgiN
MFEVTARLKINEGELDEFKRQAAEIMRLARELDTKTLRYDWFVSADGVSCEVRESYADADGLVEHNSHVKDARDRLFHDYAYGHDMTIYAEPSPGLADLIERMAAHVAFNRFSLFQRLNGDGRGAEGRAPSFEATARLKIREGRLDGFKQQAAEVMRQMREQDDEPLRYDWFLSDDGTECEVHELYPDADSLLEHQQKVAGAKAKLFLEFVADHTMAFYGELSPALAGALQAMGTSYERYSFLQGLHADVDVPEEVIA